MYRLAAKDIVLRPCLQAQLIILFLTMISTLATAQVEPGLVRAASPVPPSALGNPYARDDGTGVRVALFDALTSINRNAKLEPSLATTWQTDSLNTWVFHLRDGVTFHNGAPFDSDAVVAVFKYLMSKDAAQYSVASYIKTIRSVEAIGPLTVAFTTYQSDPILPNRLANVSLVEPRAWQRLGADRFAREPVGTGPFTVVDWGLSSRVVELAAFDNAWRQSKDIKRVRMPILPDSTTRLQALLSGQVDIAINLDPDSIPQIEEAGLTVLVLPAAHIVTIALRNIGDAPDATKDKRVRQALNYAVNKQVMADQILSGYVRVASQITTPEAFGYNPALAPYEYNPELARQLLAKAGYKKGLALTVGVFSGQTPADTLLFQLMQKDLAAVGIDVTLRALPFPELMRRINSDEWGEIDAFSTTLSSASLGDASQAIERLSCAYPTPFFCEPTMTDAIEQSEHEMDPAKRKAQLSAILTRFHELAPALLLVDYSSITGMSPRVSNYQVRSNGIKFEEVTLSDH